MPTKPKTDENLPPMLIDKITWVPVGKLKRYPDNPRIGNKKAITESIKSQGFVKVLLVQKATMFVLDGNHTHQCATELGYDKLPCVLLDISDDQAAKLVLSANRIGDLATYDAEALHTVMELTGFEGTGYSEVDFNYMNDALDTMDMDMLDSVINPVVSIMGEGADAETVIVPTEKPKPKEDEPGVFEDAPDDLYGSLSLKAREHFVFDTVGWWGFPVLHDDMLVQPDEIPSNLKAWAGSASKGYEDDEQWWLYTVGVDSTSGIRDLSKVIVCFYAYDHYFDKFWDHPERWVAKMINSGIKYAITPDWSHWGDRPNIEGFYGLYKQRVVGRYMADAGVKIIPNVAIMPKDYIDEYVRPTLPDHLPVIAIQFQAVERDLTPEDIAEIKDELLYVIETCNADLTLIYAGVTGGRIFQEMVDSGLVKNNCRVIEARRIALDAQALKRRKKKTL